jgi:hypothetical protein
MKIVKELDRRDLVLAVWSAEFVRALANENGHNSVQERTRDPMILRERAERSAERADRAIEALRLLVDVEFRSPVMAHAPAGSERVEVDGQCHMPWEDFVANCRATAFTDDDGFGVLATHNLRISNIRVYPSEALHRGYDRPSWATHVVWYNK